MTDRDAYLLFHMERARRGGSTGWQVEVGGVWMEATADEVAVLERMEGQGPP